MKFLATIRFLLIDVFPFRAVASLLFAGAIASIFPSLSGKLTATIIVLAALISMLTGVAKAISATVRRNFDDAVKPAIRAVFILLAILPCLALGDLMHLAVFYPYYWWVIGADAKQKRFPWGDSTLFATDSILLHVLVYDPTRSLEKDFGIDKRDPQTGLWVHTRHLIGPFLVEDMYSQ